MPDAMTRGIVYDGVDLSDIFEVHDVSVPLFPAIEAVAQEIAERPGSYFQSRKVRTREIRIKLGLAAGSRCPIDIYHAWRERAGALAKPEPRPLYLKEDAYLMAMLTGESGIENLGYRGVAELTFTCFDPFFYGPERKVQMKAGSNRLRVLGGCATYPKFELTGFADGEVTLADEGSGRKVRVTGLKSETRLVIDMERHRCTVNGSYKKADMSVTDFWPLEPGSCSLSLSGGGGIMAYRERHL